MIARCTICGAYVYPDVRRGMRGGKEVLIVDFVDRRVQRRSDHAEALWHFSDGMPCGPVTILGIGTNRSPVKIRAPHEIVC